VNRDYRNIRQKNEKNTARFEQMQISAINCGQFGHKMRHVLTSVQATGKHKHIIFRHLRKVSTAVDSTVCHNINKTVFT